MLYVLHGGSWGLSQENLRSLGRGRLPQNSRLSAFTFRLIIKE